MNTITPVPPLAEAERNQSGVQKMRDYIAREIEVLRTQLENDLDEKKTARVRGELMRLRKLARYLDGMPDIKVSGPTPNWAG